MTASPPKVEITRCSGAALALAAALADFVARLGDDRLRYARLRPQLRATLGLPPDEADLPARLLYERVHPQDLGAARIAFEAPLPGDRNTSQAEVRLRDANGRWRPFLIRRATTISPAVPTQALLAIGLDLSPQLQSQRLQIERLREFELTARAAGIGSWSSDATTRQPRWSEHTLALHGLPADAPGAPLGEWVDRFVHPDDRAAVRQRFRDWLAGGSPLLQQEFRIVRPDGSVRQLLSHSRIEGRPGNYDIYGLLQDVTEQRAAQAALREASERITLATHGAGIGTWEQDCASGRVHWDEQMWRLRGLQPQAQVPDLAERLAMVHPDDRAPMLAEVSQAAESGRPATLEFRVQWPDGSWHWLSSRATVVRDDDGRVRRRIGVNWDVTDARSAQLAREQSAAAQRSNEAKSRFLSRMSHELRTPLNAVLGFTQLLLAGGERLSPQARQQHLQQVELAGKHLLALIDDVLDLSRLEGGELRIAVQPVALGPLVEQTLPLVAELAQRFQVRVRSRTPELSLCADPTRLRQVLLNLLTNAVKYNRPGGEVWIEAQRSGERVRVAVCDSGRGMNAAELQQAFEPFNRLGREFDGIEGTGIGLPIARSLVQQMGGTLHASSTPGRGSRFELELPAATVGGGRLAGAATAAAAAGAATPAGTPPPAQAAIAGPLPPRRDGQVRRRLLYVDDNPVNVVLVQELLARRPGLQLATAADAAGGLRQALQTRPDLILLDLQLPDGDGVELLQRLRAEPATAAIPCIALSASALPEEVERALAAGFAAYWTKPLDFDRFHRLLDALFGAEPARA